MAENQFSITDIDFDNLEAVAQTKSNGSFRQPIIKEEIVKDDDILLFTPAEMEEFSNANANEFEIVDNIGNTVTIPENSSFNIPFSDEQLNQLINTNNFNPKINFDLYNKLNQLINTNNFNPKINFDLYNNKNVSSVKTDGNLSHFVKYKVQDGKHTKVWQCGICGKEFGHQYILMRHLPTHTDERKFQCNVCGKAFRQMSTLSQHRAIHSAERPYICEICQKTFNRVSTLISHRKTHTGHKPHRCHLCNKAFHQKGNLRNHIFTHTNERPYKCDVCSKGFNQMSNLMCHKLKAHQRADKPRYTCQSCGKEFQKRMGLRNHEQYEHGDMNGPGTSNGAPRIRYTNGVLVDPINTAAMQHALATNQTPFALLRPLNGIPVLVRVLAAGDKQMLVPATAEDLKKHGQITITPKEENEGKPVLVRVLAAGDKQMLVPATAEDLKKHGQITITPKEENEGNKAEVEQGNTAENGKPTGRKPTGSTVQIKIPVVATVIQRCGKDGNMCMDVESPGPSSGGLVQDSYLVNAPEPQVTDTQKTTETQVVPEVSTASEISNQVNPTMSSQSANPIEYFDLTESDTEKTNLTESDTEKTKELHQSFSFGTDVFGSNLQFDGEVIDLEGNQENINNVNIYTEGMFDMQAGDSATHVFEILDKPTALICIFPGIGIHNSIIQNL
ncbi:Zinc finger, C2H2 type [Popillia japonica]|uniref:Zinc finger, C2H2 type n=1 Tax=Popillia japonica TaxID=7064 RepID=A0AAW1LU03_POPJA